MLKASFLLNMVEIMKLRRYHIKLLFKLVSFAKKLIFSKN